MDKLFINRDETVIEGYDNIKNRYLYMELFYTLFDNVIDDEEYLFSNLNKLIIVNKQKDIINKNNVFIKSNKYIDKMSDNDKNVLFLLEEKYINSLNMSINNSDIILNNTSLFLNESYSKSIKKYCNANNITSIDSELIDIIESMIIVSELYYLDSNKVKPITTMINLANKIHKATLDKLKLYIDINELKKIITEDNKVELKGYLNDYIKKFVKEISNATYYNKKAFNKNNKDTIANYICSILNSIIKEINIFGHCISIILYCNKNNNLRLVKFTELLNYFILNIYGKELDVYIKHLFVDLLEEEYDIVIDKKDNRTHKVLSLEQHRETCIRYNIKNNKGGSTKTCTGCLISEMIENEDGTVVVKCDLDKLNNTNN